MSEISILNKYKLSVAHLVKAFLVSCGKISFITLLIKSHGFSLSRARLVQSTHTQKTPNSFRLRGDISKICPPSFQCWPSSGKLKIRSLSRLGLTSFQIHFNIIIPFITTSQRQPLLYDSPDENSARFSHHSHACYNTRSSHTPRFGHPNTICEECNDI